MYKEKSGLLNARRYESVAGYLFCAPSFLGFLFFVLIPVVYAGVLSFSKINLFTNATTFVGFQNYTALARTMRFETILGNTLWYMIFATAFNTVIGLVLAIALNSQLGRRDKCFLPSCIFFSIVSRACVCINHMAIPFSVRYGHYKLLSRKAWH